MNDAELGRQKIRASDGGKTGDVKPGSGRESDVVRTWDSSNSNGDPLTGFKGLV